MEGELGSGAKIAITLIVLGVIISIVFVILGFVRGSVNQGVTTVQNSMSAMSQSQFDDYDQQILSGTQVMSALTLFQGQPVGLVVNTLADQGGGVTQDYGAIFSGYTANAAAKTYEAGALPAKAAGTSWYTLNIDMTSGAIRYNLNTLPTKQSGTNPFIRPTAKFIAELIKDTTGTITGVAFTQQ